MAKGDEVVPRSSASPQPLPGETGAPPTPADILAWIGSADGRAWFPSRHAAASGTNRDALDDPLNQLRAAGLVRVAEWERGVGQGYLLTVQGEAALATGHAILARADEPEKVSSSETELTSSPTPLPPELPWPVVVAVLCVLNLLWYFVGLVMVLRAGLPVWPFLAEGNIDIAHRTGAVFGNDLIRGDWWRLLTACFVHGNGAHLLLNLFALIVVGPVAEDLWGRWRLLVIYVVSGLAGSCLTMTLAPASVVAGASGAIWGLLLSVAAWLVLHRREVEREILVEDTQRLTVCIVLSALFSFLPGISWQGHLGGAVAGFVVAFLLNAMRSANGRRRALASMLLAVFVLGTVGGLLTAMKWSRPWVRFRQSLDEEESKRAIREAAEAYDRDVAPLLAELSPAKVKAANDLLGYKGFRLMNQAEPRNRARLTEARARFTELKGVGDAVVGRLDEFAAGPEAIAHRREQARRFAVARSRSFELVLAMLDSPANPDAAVWAEWEKARSEGDAIWSQLPR